MMAQISLRRVAFAFFIILEIASSASHATEILRLHTTSSVHSSGLLDYLLPIIEQQENLEIHATMQGSGQAMRSASLGDSDVILVHAPLAEKKFVESGYGLKRNLLMYNQFVIIGEKTDIANIAKSENAAEAFASIAKTNQQAQALFISRGDNSGTHLRELEIWKNANIDITKQIRKTKNKNWYLETGSGMGRSLNIAFEKNAYILTDYSSWLNYRNKNKNFQILFQKDKILHNQYSVIAVNPKKHPHVKFIAAQKFIAFLLSPKGQKLIANYKINEEQSFFPNADSNR